MIDGKVATGDGTKIVCMNDDYDVHITFKNCDSLLNLPVRKMVVKYGMEYQEVPISTSLEGSKLIYTSHLPLLDCQHIIELGVVGKQKDDLNLDPVYTTTSAKFECIKSVMCGAPVLKYEKTLMAELAVVENNTYTAVDYGVDGFASVKVLVPSRTQEHPTVALDMSNGDQIIRPTHINDTIAEVRLTKPSSLIPENIKAGINIGGIIGTYSPSVDGTKITRNGTYTALEEGIDGFYKVEVAVPPPDDYVSDEEIANSLLEIDELLGG
jgi:hypothetical protein